MERLLAADAFSSCPGAVTDGGGAETKVRATEEVQANLTSLWTQGQVARAEGSNDTHDEVKLAALRVDIAYRQDSERLEPPLADLRRRETLEERRRGSEGVVLCRSQAPCESEDPS